MTKIATIIVNYNAGALIAQNLSAALREQAVYPGSHIYIVDNASPEGDARMLAEHIARENLSDRVTLLAEKENRGFAAGNNVALREILNDSQRADFVFLLNPDAYPLEGCYRRLIDFLTATRRAGIAGARLEGADGALQVSAFNNFTALGEFVNTINFAPISRLFSSAVIGPPARAETYEADWVCGAAAMIRTEVFDAVGLFDEDYFLYYEETDFMTAARRAGWGTWYVHDARAVHLVGQSTGVKDGKAADRVSPPYWFASRRHYFRKNYGAAYAFMADAAWIAGTMLFWLKLKLAGRDGGPVRANLAAFLRSPKQ